MEVSGIYRFVLTTPAGETTQERNHPYRLGLGYLSQISFISVEVDTSQELCIMTTFKHKSQASADVLFSEAISTITLVESE